MKKIITDYRKGLLFTFLGATLWGLSGVFGEYLLNISKLNSIWVISNRVFYSGLLMLIILYLKEKKKIFIVFSNKKDTIKIINFSFFGLLVCQATYFLAIKYTNAGTATILQYLGPTMIMLYYCLRKRRLPILNEFIAIVLSFLGTLLIATHLNFSTIVISPLGLLWGILSAMGLAIYNVLSIDLIRKYGSILTVAWGLFISGAVIQIITGSFYLPEAFSLMDFLALLGVIFFGTIISYTIYLAGVQFIGAVKGSVIACFEPISAIIFSVILLGTNFVLYDLTGVVIILISVFILNKK